MKLPGTWISANVAHIEGISATDAGTGKRIRLAVPAAAAVNSIDGLALDGQDLLGIQGSPYLARTVRIRLSSDGLSVRDVSVLSSRGPADSSQTTGVVVGARFFTIADQPPGSTGSSNTPPEDPFPTILSIPLSEPGLHDNHS